MKQLISAMALGLFSAAGMAADFGLDESCNFNGTAVNTAYHWNGGDYVYCQLPSSIVVNDTIELDTDNAADQSILWVINGVVTVGNGQVAGATPATVDQTVLKMASGAQMAAATQSSALVITRGASIDANGRSSKPIVFSSLDDGFDGRGEWAGVLLAGFGESNACVSDDSNCELTSLGLSGYHYAGGADTLLSSGRMNYVVIAEAGSFAHHGLIQQNGLTLLGVNSSTTLTNIHVQGTKGDGIELRGGSAVLSKTWASCNRDDAISWKEGYQGEIQNLNIVQSGPAGNALDMASNFWNASALPVSHGVIDAASITKVGGFTLAPLKAKQGTEASFTDLVISGYGDMVCNSPFGQHAVTTADFNQVNYDCDNVTGLLPAADASTTGYDVVSFWTEEQGNPGCF